MTDKVSNHLYNVTEFNAAKFFIDLKVSPLRENLYQCKQRWV